MTATPSTTSIPIPPIATGRFSYFIPGIFCEKDNPRDWYLQAQAWTHAHGYGLAGGFGYSADAVGAVLARDLHADLVAGDLLNASVAGFSPLVVGAHSNGCQIILNAAKRHPSLRGLSLHLLAAASPHDCEENGLNLIASQIDQLFLYVSPDDEVLVVGEALPGFGDLGRHGPTNVSAALAKKLTIVSPAQPNCGHSDWVTRDFYDTMRSIGRNGAAT